MKSCVTLDNDHAQSKRQWKVAEGYPSEECVLTLFGIIKNREKINKAKFAESKSGEPRSDSDTAIETLQRLWKAVGKNAKQQRLCRDWNNVPRQVKQTFKVQEMELRRKMHEELKEEHEGLFGSLYIVGFLYTVYCCFLYSIDSLYIIGALYVLLVLIYY